MKPSKNKNDIRFAFPKEEEAKVFKEMAEDISAIKEQLPAPEPAKSTIPTYFNSLKNLNIHVGPGSKFPITMKFAPEGKLTILEVVSGEGSKSGWGKLPNELGWVSMDYLEKR